MTDLQPVRRLTPARQLALIAQRAGVEIRRLSGNQVAIAGTLSDVGQAIDVIEQAGWLVSAAPAQPHGGDRVLVNIRLALRVQAHARQAAPRRKLPRWVFWLIGGAVVAFVVGIVLVVVAAVNFVDKADLGLVSVVAIAVALLAAVLVSFRSNSGKTISGTFKGKIH